MALYFLEVTSLGSNEQVLVPVDKIQRIYSTMPDHETVIQLSTNQTYYVVESYATIRAMLSWCPEVQIVTPADAKAPAP